MTQAAMKPLPVQTALYAALRAMLDQSCGNFYGVGHSSQWDVWQAICPDPNLILRLSDSAFTLPCPRLDPAHPRHDACHTLAIPAPDAIPTPLPIAFCAPALYLNAKTGTRKARPHELDFELRPPQNQLALLTPGSAREPLDEML